MSAVLPSASYSITVRLSITNRPGMLGRVAMAIGDAGGDIGAVDLVEAGRERILRDITIKARDSVHGQQIVNRLNAEIAKIQNRPDVRQEWATQGAAPMVMTPEEFGRYLDEDIVKWERIVKISGAKPDQ